MSGGRKTLIRGVNWIGDAVMTMPAIRAAGGATPGPGVEAAFGSVEGNQTTLLANQWTLPLFERDPNVDAQIVYPGSSIGNIVRLAALLRKEKFSTALMLPNSFGSAAVAFLAGISDRIGYDRDSRGFMLTRRVPVTKDLLKRHQIHYYLNLIRAAGFDAPYRLPWLYLDLEERMEARKTLSALKRPVIGINPGASYGSAKRWPADGFAQVIQGLIETRGAGIVIFGSQKEAPIADEILNLLPPGLAGSGRVLNLSGRTTLRGLCALISECDLLVTNDSGPMHIGYATGTPLVAIFGSTEPSLTGPPTCQPEDEFAYPSVALRGDVECSPCFKRTCNIVKSGSASDTGRPRCMEAVTADEVFNAALKILPGGRAVLFDRDGTLCVDADYLNSFDNFKPYAGLDGLHALKGKGYKLIGISNQSGIARGRVDEGFVGELHRVFIEKYGFDGFYHCPHMPGEHCACRKPSPGMLLRARAEFGIDLKKSFVVGDKNSDIEAALFVGATPIFIDSGKNVLKNALKISGVRTIKTLDELHGLL
jgi:heptosyltransferase-2